MGPHASIGQLNLIKIGRLVLNEGTRIGNLNVIHGTFSVRTGSRCLLGNRNLINGDATDEPTVLWLGDVSGITAGHYVNVNRSVRLGNFTTVAGAGSQIWAHGFIHMSEGVDRAEVRGKVTLGDNVYVGSQSCLNPGITIGNAVSVGAHSSVSTNLLKPGLYVSQPLRYIATMPEDRMAKLLRLEDTEGRVFYERRPIDADAPNTRK
jgi:UDP-3-O-[3-hydroxymyristoyl] glucosamine N-acyltransferase